MTDIYIDPGVAGMPDAVDQLRHLTETGHRVFILGELPASMEDVPSIARAEELPDVPPARLLARHHGPRALRATATTPDVDAPRAQAGAVAAAGATVRRGGAGPRRSRPPHPRPRGDGLTRVRPGEARDPGRATLTPRRPRPRERNTAATPPAARSGVADTGRPADSCGLPTTGGPGAH